MILWWKNLVNRMSTLESISEYDSQRIAALELRILALEEKAKDCCGVQVDKAPDKFRGKNGLLSYKNLRKDVVDAEPVEMME